MTQVGAPGHDPIPIGDTAAAPFVRLPDPRQVFKQRGERFRALAAAHELKPYLLFLADLSDVQHDIQDGLPPVEMPAPDALARAREHAMPPLDRARFTSDPACDATFERVFASCGACLVPEAASAALQRVRATDAPARAAMAQAVLADAIPVEALAEHVFVAAALQVHFARLAARLDAVSLVPVGDGVCPACGGPPVASMVVGWPGAHGTRFCACATCATLWNYVRIRCTVCGSTKSISFEEIAGGPGTVKAECCGECRSYVKVFYQHKDPSLDPVADDVASLGLDLKLRETDLRRAGVDPFLLGY